MAGFFSGSELLDFKKSTPKVAKCGLCQLYKKCKSGKMKPFGNFKKRILVVGEAPGADEDKKGKPFRGKSGRLLKRTFKRVKIKLDRDCLQTNALICRPPNNETPTNEQISWCNPNLQNTIRDFNPDVILTVGKPALQAVLTGIWDYPLEAMKRWAGFMIPCQQYNSWIVPTWHPSYILREVSNSYSGTPIKRIFREHLRLVAEIERRPYDKVPDWKKKIEILYDEDRIVKAIDRFIKKGGPVAIDFETNMLKPDSKEGIIVCAAICWKGKRTIAFPWHGVKVLNAFQRLMRAGNPKIAHNLKFEDRWFVNKQPHAHEVVRYILGEMGGVKNWGWDTMVNAHLIDNRPGVCALDFQLFVNFGLSPYSQHISPFLAQKLSYGINKIKEVNMEHLLLYCGIDALGCYKLAMMQRKRLMIEGWKS